MSKQITFSFGDDLQTSVSGTNMEELMDGLMELKKAEYVLAFAKEYMEMLNEKQRENLVAIMLCMNDDMKAVLEFAELCNEKEVRMLRVVFEQCKDAESIYWYAKYVPGANISKLEDAICQVEPGEDTGYYLWNFALQVPGADIQKLQDAVIAKGDCKAIIAFAKHVKGADITRLEDAFIASGNSVAFYEFAQEIPESNLKKLENAVIQSGNPYAMLRFAMCISQCDIDRLKEAIIETGDAESICNFARFVDCEDIEELEDAIVNTNDVHSIREFAAYVKDANVRRLWRVTKSIGEKKDMDNFKKDVSRMHYFW